MLINAAASAFNSTITSEVPTWQSRLVKLLQVPQPSQSTVFDSHGHPACDLERLLSCVTPVLMLDGKVVTEGAERQAACLVRLLCLLHSCSA